MVDLIKLRNMQNNLFFTPHVIFNRVSKVHRNKILEYNLGDFISWCYELENEILTDVEAMIAFDRMQLGFPDLSILSQFQSLIVGEIASSSSPTVTKILLCLS